MMNSKAEVLAFKFLRTYLKPFTVKEMKRIFDVLGYKISLEDVKDFLQNHPNVLELQNNHFITKAAAFTGEIFSMMPTAREVEQGVLVIGDRCMPFIESERIPSTYKFYIDGKRVPLKVGTFDSDMAIDMYELCGEEYASQYIASDPANADLKIRENDFELPNYVHLTGLDLDFLAENYGFSKGDRILCCVSDWDNAKIKIMIHDKGGSPFEQDDFADLRRLWYSNLEKYLLESFEAIGPLGSIEDQIIDVMFDHRKDLCVPACGSIEEFLHHYTKKIAIEQFGVETRLWYKGQEVPAFGGWNRNFLETMASGCVEIPFDQFMLDSIPDFVYDLYVLDCYYKRSQNIFESVLESISQNEVPFGEEALNCLSLNLKERDAILSQSYNWFADQSLGPVREKALDLYSQVFLLVRKIDYIGGALVDFPQQELVILSQLFGHLTQMMNYIAYDDEIEETCESYMLSLEGMSWNFDSIKDVIYDSLEKERLNRFRIMKSSE